MALEVLIYVDAMTSYRGDTPKEGAGRHSKAGTCITSRIFGCQIICGTIDFMCYVIVDQLIPGGANLAIEVQRKSMELLSKELEVKNHLMPRIMHWQFDNCGENKVCWVCG